MAVFTVRLPDSLIDRIKEAAEGTTVAKWMTEAAQKMLDGAPAGDRVVTEVSGSDGASARNEIEALQGETSSLKRDLREVRMENLKLKGQLAGLEPERNPPKDDPFSDDPDRHAHRPAVKRAVFDKAMSVNPEFLNKVLTSSRRKE